MTTSITPLAAFLGGALTLLAPCSVMLLPAFFAYAFTSRTTLLARTGLFWLGLIGLIIWLVTRLLPGPGIAGNRSGQPGPGESPEQVLDRMFALGEIDEATYRSRRTALGEMRRPS